MKAAAQIEAITLADTFLRNKTVRRMSINFCWLRSASELMYAFLVR